MKQKKIDRKREHKMRNKKKGKKKRDVKIMSFFVWKNVKEKKIYFC